MALIGLNEVSLSLGGPLLLDGVELQIEEGERIGLVGRNGAGKSTLMRLLMGSIAPDSGKVSRQKGVRVATLPQVVPRDLSGTVAEQMNEVIKDLDVDEWESEKRVTRTLAALSIELTEDVSTMSAGMKRRVLLAKALIAEPDLLLLDEPTTHLDLPAIARREEILHRWRGSFCLVSHDRAFLRGVTNRILDLDRGRLTSYDCDYATYLDRREALLEQEEGERAQFDKKLAQEEQWIRRGVKARRKRNQGRVRELMAMRAERSTWRKESGNVRARLQEAEKTGRLVIKADGITHSFGDREVIKDFSTVISRGDRIGIMGPNGCGKSTLLKILLGELKPSSGELRHGTKIETAVFDQLQLTLDETKTVRANIGEGADKIDFGGRQKHVVGYLQDFLFTPEQIRSSVKKLSGGERNRLLLAKILTKPANVLILDEPTNDLDVETLEVLENLLSEFDGTLLVVSHDREFLDNVVTSTFVFEEGIGVKEYDGGYSDWQRQIKAKSKGSSSKGKKGKGDRKRDKPRRLNFKEKTELEELPDLIERLEIEKNVLETKMADPKFYKKSGGVVARSRDELEALTKRIEESMARWEELEAIGSSSKS